VHGDPNGNSGVNGGVGGGGGGTGGNGGAGGYGFGPVGAVLVAGGGSAFDGQVIVTFTAG
jgi:hypothetical protein